MGGLLCGNMGIVKSFLTEITDDTNRSASFYLYSLAWTMGAICAPLVGGLLSKPAEKYPSVFSSDPSSIWVEYPYLLPCLLTVAWNVLAALICGLFMVETLGAKKEHNRTIDSQVQNKLHEECDSLEDGVEMSSVFSHAAEDRNSSDEPVRGRSSSVPNTEDSNIRARSISTEKQSTYVGGGRTGKTERSTYGRVPLESVEESAGDIHYRERSSSGATQSTTSSTIDRSLESDQFDPENPAPLDDGEEICCPTFFDYISDLGDRFGWTAKEHSPDGNMDSSSHELIHADNPGVTAANKSAQLSTGTVLKQRAVILSTCTYGTVCAAAILIDETLPLFFKLETARGGFGFDSQQIGVLLSTGAAGMMIMSILCIPLIDGVSNKYLSKLSISLLVPLCLAFPLIALLNNHVLVNMGNETAHMWLLWPLLILVNTFKNLFTNFSFTAAVIMVNYSCTDEHLGAVNGLGQSLGALARSLGPAVGGLLWSVATKYDFVYLNFVAVVAVFALNYYVSYLAPASLDHRKKKATR